MGGCLSEMKNRERKNFEGSMTVFFCLTLLLIGAIICTCLESARTAGLRFMAKTASDSALQSVFADYHGQLWEDYHVFFHYDEKGELAETMDSYLEYYETPTKDLYGMQDYSDLWGLTVDGVTVTEKKTALSDGGRLFLEQAVEYEKYQIAENILEMLLDRVGILDEIEKIRTFAVRLSESFELIQKISTLYQDVRDGVNQVRALGEQIREVLADGNVELTEAYGLLQTFADKAVWLKQLASEYLNTSEEVEELASDLASEYGAGEDTVYGQQIQQLKAFAINGLLGNAVGNVVEKADGLLSQIYSVMEEIKQFQNQEQLKALYEKVSGIIGSGISLMQDLESVLDSAENDSAENNSDESEDSAGDSGGESDDGDRGDDEVDKDAGQSLLSLVKQWKNTAVLSLAMGESALKTRADYFSDTSALPSETAGKTLTDVTLAEKGLFVFYITDAFTNALSGSQKNFAYQQEYILFGKDDSRSNLAAMAERLLAVREGLNLAYLLTNSQMRTMAETAAYALVGATGLYPLVLITQFIILAAWAFAESVVDLQALFQGEGVPLWKSETTWKTSVSGLVSEGIALTGEEAGVVSNEIGLSDGQNLLSLKFSYNDYMKLFLLVKDTQTLCLRSMDIIQEEIGSSESGFLMADCYGAAQVTVDFSAPYRLITLPLVGAAESGHQIQAVSSYQYR